MDKTILIAILSSGALSTLISGIFSLINNKKKNDDAIAKGVRQLLYDRIKEKGKSYISKGEITDEELQDIISMHSIYHTDLDGNGYLDELMNSVKRLKLIVK